MDRGIPAFVAVGFMSLGLMALGFTVLPVRHASGTMCVIG
jgi:hypothetical protein